MQGTNKHTCTTPLLPWRNNHPLYPKHWDLWEAERGFLSLTTKNTFLNLWWCCFRGLKTKLQILIEQVLCSIADDLRNSKEVLWWVNETLKKKRSEVRFPKASLANYGDKFHWTLLVMTELVNELMNEWCIYIALYCVLLYTKGALQSCGGTLLNHHQCAASTWMMRRLPQDNGTSAVTTHQLQVERRESQSQSSGWGLLRGHDWQGPVVEFFPWHRGYTATFYEKCHGIFNDHRESGPRFNVSSERRHKDPHRPQGEHSLLVSLTPLP